MISRIPVVGVAGDSGRLYPFSTIGGEGYESLISCCRFNLDGGFVLDVSAKRGQQVMAGRLILFLIVTLVFGGLFLSGRVNKGEDIHITE